MKILLFGSIAAGKTTIAKQLLNQYAGYEFISIDVCRKKFGDYSMEGEDIAKSKFIEAIQKGKNQIIEASGLGKLGSDIYEKIACFDEDVLLMIMHIEINETNRRIANRVWDTPFPGRQEKLQTIIQSVNFGIQFGRIPMIWSERSNTTIIQIENKDAATQDFILETAKKYLKLK
jgi:shikimate kinase